MREIDQLFPRTIIIRHRRENLKKCSLRGLEGREDLLFLAYPFHALPPLDNYIMLAIDAPPLTLDDRHSGLLFLDATWRYAEKMLHAVDRCVQLPRRSIPSNYKTAYPRRQEDCPFPDQGLATVEALYVAMNILERSTEGILDHYYWKESFLYQNVITTRL